MKLKGKIRFNEPLGKYTSFKIGGDASILFEPKDKQDLVNCLKEARKDKVPCFVIGGGTNLLIDDSGFKGVVIKLTSPCFRHISSSNNIVTVGAGASIQQLIKYLSRTRFSGYEFLVGIPGSIGGALAMNAGVTINGRRWSIGDIVHKIKAVDRNAQILNLTREKLRFSYRKSNLNRYIIIGAQLKFNKDSEANIKNRIKDFLSNRNKRLDLSRPSAGCIFKNPSIHLSAGALIDRCGLKGKRCGGAMISNKHANLILNFNRASAKDVLKLIRIIKKKIKDKFDIKLKEEIKIVT